MTRIIKNVHFVSGVCDSGLGDADSRITESGNGNDQNTGDEHLNKNISQIEALLKRINDENKKTREILERIDKGEFKKDTNRKPDIDIKTHCVKTKEMDKKEAETDDETLTENSNTNKSGRVSFSGSWTSDQKADDVTFASSMEQKRYPIVIFNPQSLGQPSSNPAGARYHLTFKVVQADAKIVSQLFHAHGFHEVGVNNNDFNLMWTGSHPKPQAFKSLLPHQRVNHFPRSYELTRKDRMYKNLERLQIAKGPKHFNFIPKSFMIPNEYSEFCAAHHRMRGAWIVKPVASSRGRGIFIVNHPNQVIMFKQWK